VHGTKYSDTLGEALHLCEIVSKNKYLRGEALSCINQERKNRSHGLGFDKTTFLSYKGEVRTMSQNILSLYA